jgi:hypothetical protein
MNPIPKNQSIEPLELMNNNPSGKSRMKGYRATRGFHGKAVTYGEPFVLAIVAALSREQSSSFGVIYSPP